MQRKLDTGHYPFPSMGWWKMISSPLEEKRGLTWVEFRGICAQKVSHSGNTATIIPIMHCRHMFRLRSTETEQLDDYLCYDLWHQTRHLISVSFHPSLFLFVAVVRGPNHLQAMKAKDPLLKNIQGRKQLYVSLYHSLTHKGKISTILQQSELMLNIFILSSLPRSSVQNSEWISSWVWTQIRASYLLQSFRLLTRQDLVLNDVRVFIQGVEKKTTENNVQRRKYTQRRCC